MKTIAPFLCLAATTFAASPDAALRESAMNALERGVNFFSREVAVEGTYLWQYSADLSQREGEGKATPTQAWVQPPGTPAVGMALLSAWQATSNRVFLEAVQATTRGLIRGQLRSGGWHYAIDLDPLARKKIAYRDSNPAERQKNVTTFDDDTTQAALRFLARTDAALNFTNAQIAEAVAYTLNAIAKAQYPVGAWPQGYEQFPDPKSFPVKRASLPPDWPRTWPGSKQYWLQYTLNDNALATIIETLLEVSRAYDSPGASPDRKALGISARECALKAGNFLLLAQLPEPQPGWAQQYNAEMHPAWARKFEPPSLTAGESQGALRTLLMLYRETGDRKFLEPVPRALAWLRRSRLPDGRLARFYELHSNKPLYFTKDYQLTYDDSDVPTHYAFKISDNTKAISAEHETLKTGGAIRSSREAKPAVTEAMRSDVRRIIAAQDAHGRWIESGKLRSHAQSSGQIIRSATFNQNVETLSRFLEATR